MKYWIISSLLLAGMSGAAQPGSISQHLKIDQFGYPTTAEKICVVNNPQAGFDFEQGDFYMPGPTLQLRKASNHDLVFSGPATAWHNGDTYEQSGDKLWWFDFSSVSTPGSYYIYDPANDRSSYTFVIEDDVYHDVLVQAVRMFFYQRSGFAKPEQYAYEWDDGASHLGPQQDLDCRLVTNPLSSNSKQLQGGWYDAGDYNKYVNFAYEPIHDMLLAYIERPMIWTDDYNIPESGNGIPDLLDEIKWELDWLRRMQLADGSVLMKMGVTDFSASSPPSTDSGFRRYGPAQASSTRMAASMYAIGAIAYQSTGIPDMQLYSDTLRQAAINAWNWVQSNPQYSYYDNAGFVSANSEIDTSYQRSALTGAAILLYALTGDVVYRSYVETNYTLMHPYQWGFWYPWESVIQDLLIYYTTLPGISNTVKNNIRNSFTSSMDEETHLLPGYLNKSCGYRAFLNDWDNVWGSNRPRGHNGATFYNIITYDLETDTAPYRNAALGYVNFLHGVNPVSLVMLTNMYEFGADKSANEMYHSWFADGTAYDNAITSLYGPPPGYQPGGFNPNYIPDPAYGGTIVPPQFQPSLKSYKDWNTSWPENSWLVTETSISNQGSYVKLLSKFVPVPCVLTVTSSVDQGQSTLRQAVSCAVAGDTIYLDLPAGDTIRITSSPLIIDKSLTLINLNANQAPVCFDNSGAGMVINAGSTVHLHDMSMEGDMALIQNYGQLHLYNVALASSGTSSQPLLNHNEVKIYGSVMIK